VDGVGLIYAAAGLAALLAAVLPRLLIKAPLSMPMVFLGAGVAAFALIDRLPNPDPLAYRDEAERLTEVCVIVALMGAGLALNRPVGRRRWRSTWHLLGVTMPLTILAVGLLGGWVLGLSVAGALLLAAALAPTDPVLASEVQVGEPSDKEDDEDETRFALTSEAGLNDGLAFPFVYAAIAIATAGAAPGGWLGRWLAVDVVWRVGVGVLVGFAVGWLLRSMFFTVPSKRLRLAEHGEGFVAIACTFLAYGLTELAQGYGFLAVFVCACVIRAGERSHGYHRILHQYVEQLERLLTVVVLVLLGGAVARGILTDVTWRELLVALGLVLVIRPVAGWVGLAGAPTSGSERAAAAYFGIRGIGSLYYMAYALGHATFPEARRLWSVVALVVVCSVVVHGITASPVMRLLDRRRGLEEGGLSRGEASEEPSRAA
jgi:NhaP-type Na+/H+ or K+/H+ antiporter